MNLKVELPVWGWELKRVRQTLRFTARDVAEWLSRNREKPGTVRGVYAMENGGRVRSVVIQRIAELFGQSECERAFRVVRAEDAQRREAQRLYHEQRKRKREEDERITMERKREAGAMALAEREALVFGKRME